MQSDWNSSARDHDRHCCPPPPPPQLAQEVRRVAQEAVSSGQIAKGRSREEADEIVDNIHRCIGNLEYVTRVSVSDSHRTSLRVVVVAVDVECAVEKAWLMHSMGSCHA